MKKYQIGILLAAVMGVGLVFPSYEAHAENVVYEATTLTAPEEKLTGWVQKEEGWYYYDADGNQITGWKKLNGYWYYMDAEDAAYPGRMIADREAEIGGETYRFNEKGMMQTGWFQKDGTWYYYKSSGAKAESEWLEIKGVRYYFTEADGAMAADCEILIDGSTYRFLDSGKTYTGWLEKEEGWYYYDASGRKAEGKWSKIKNVWYYFKSAVECPEFPGLMAVSEERVIDGEAYLFTDSGAMYTGWLEKEEGWYYYKQSGAKVQEGWCEISGKKYYFLAVSEENLYPGIMYEGEQKEIDGLLYYFNSNGSMKTGWLPEDDAWYFLGTDGQKASGWIKTGGKWYYMDPENEDRMFDGGWKQLNNIWYYFRSSGAMQTGWVKIGSYWYYFDASGAMQTGWKQIGGNWYYMYKENDPHGGPYGAMACNRSIDGYWLDLSGKWILQDLAAMSQKAQMYSSSTPYLILVNRSTHKVGVFRGSVGKWENVQYWDCADGAPSTPTVMGTFRVGSKGYYFDSGAARCYWYTQFYGNYLFHSVLYNKNGTLMDGRVGMPLSHGCVRLKIENAKWIYDNIPVGTTVVVYQ
ncbi:MAG: L,D-transpeptidase family protein [Dorea sp.]|nr:L,D-transpeptidase family protein [Dorea sp.]